ncbi:SPOR domain-containing protein [Desulfovibrio sp.]|uniref:SPOR domain-containing protein n=1 Tax=Desulfovibrio sp. TaxID=885 RepID=UPI00260FF45F|nr:SPOR domain-containing protein [Desulfovibrio sp.]
MSPSRNTGRVPFLRLRLSSLLALAFLGVAAIALAYVGGVMTGRASASAERRLAAVEAGRSAPQAPAPGATAARDAPSAGPGQEGPGILSPEELRFARALRNEDGAPEPPALQRPAPSPIAAAPQVAPQASPIPGQVPAQLPGQTGQPLPGPGSAPGGVPQALAPTQAAAQPGPMQDYVFQMGAFRDEDSVDSLRQRLEGRGLRTRMQREGKLYVVLVLLRGDAARAEEVTRIAEELRLGKPMLKSRKPVQP